MEDKRPIPQLKIITLRDKIKRFHKDWAQRIADEMSTKQEPVDAQRVYNIVHDVIRSNEWRSRFVVAANSVIKQANERKKQKKETIS